MHLTENNRIIKSRINSKAVLRDNSGIIFTIANGNNYGEFQKLLVLDNYAFALVKPFNICSADFMLCEDNVTDAQLNEHMVPLSLPSRFV